MSLSVSYVAGEEFNLPRVRAQSADGPHEAVERHRDPERERIEEVKVRFVRGDDPILSMYGPRVRIVLCVQRTEIAYPHAYSVTRKMQRMIIPTHVKHIT